MGLCNLDAAAVDNVIFHTDYSHLDSTRSLKVANKQIAHLAAQAAQKIARGKSYRLLGAD